MHKIWQIALWTSLFKQESFFRFGKIFRWRYWQLAREKSKYKVYKRNNLRFWALKERFVSWGFHNFHCNLNSINFLWQGKSCLYILKWRDDLIQIGKNNDKVKNFFSLPQWLCCWESANTFWISSDSKLSIGWFRFCVFSFWEYVDLDCHLLQTYFVFIYWVQTVVNLIW